MQGTLVVVFLFVLVYVGSATDECPSPHFFQCKHDTVAKGVKCISQLFVCDGETDCADNSDEEDCRLPRPPPPVKCKSDEYQCKDNSHCIPLDEFCDNKLDCLDASDEYEGCHLNKTCNDFKCKNGFCVTKKWVCDGTNDCGDNSDEANCDNVPIPPESCNNTIGKYLCTNNRCISLSLTCNGQDDCGDDTDENPAKCEKAKAVCKGQNNPCLTTCSPTPKGAKCSCPVGYTLKNDTACVDVDECMEYGVCSQICRNTLGLFYCVCEPGFKLLPDERTCKAEHGEALMIFASKTSIRGYFLDSEIYYPVAEDLQHVVGVSMDSTYIYWSDIQLRDEAIYRSREDGTDREVIVSAGLGCPEDIAVDWVAGNIYFTDSMYKHIGVCSDGGNFCTVIVRENTEKPRGIALLPSEGKMYWSDWGVNAHISVAYMDGSQLSYFIKNNIGWPNGLTIDYPAKRLYWVDAKLKVIESIQLDGNDRRTVLQELPIHPYSIAIFENKLYWSDWSSNSIHSCNKFTGKNFTTLFQKNETVYGIHIFHSSLKARYTNPCVTKPCSQLCLLSVNRTFTCACTLDKQLNVDKRTCSDLKQRKRLAISTGKKIIDYYHEMLGKPQMKSSGTMDHISHMTYDPLTDTIIAVDEVNKSIFRFNIHDGTSTHIIPIVDGMVRSIAFDYFGNNLYISNTSRNKIDVHSLTTGEKTEFFFRGKPYDLVLIPEKGIMFVVFRTTNEFHIDQVQMNGLGSRNHVIESPLVGPEISLAYDPTTSQLYWADEGTGRIESITANGQNRQLVQTGVTSPVSLAVVDNEVFWTSRRSNRLNWADKTLMILEKKGLKLDVNSSIDILYLQTLTGHYSNGPVHPCQRNNGDCSHICLVTAIDKRLCACPTDYIINPDQKTCRLKTSCTIDEFKCSKNNHCISKVERCNGVDDCPDGEDEKNCTTGSPSCEPNEFACLDGECIKSINRCDSVFNCKDHSDEMSCSDKSCGHDQFRCYDGTCIPSMLVCNGMADCLDHSDEEYCGESHACEDHYFKCSTGQCIPQNWECDGQVDCNDGSDEHPLCKPIECGESMFSCRNGRCIDILLKCNGIDDCDDNSDEAECVWLSEALICTKEQYRCRNSTICISERLKCDGRVDCPKGDDERDCVQCIGEKEFACGNGRCVPKEWVCDDADDCGDLSDERDCNSTDAHPVPAGPKHNCSAAEYSCDSGFCVRLELVCDGEKNCFDGSDEDGQCAKACETKTCEQLCFKTPKGSLCGCRDGYNLAADGVSCEDIDECQHDVCPQICTNQPGSFACSCFGGYALRLDRVTCKAIGPALRIFTATADDIRVMSPPTMHNSISVVHHEPGMEITGLDVNARENTVFWSDEIMGTISKLNLHTKTVDVVSKGVGRPEILVVDWITDNVYFASLGRAISIKMCNVEAMNCATVVHNEGYHDRVTAIAVEPNKEYLFWSQAKWKMLENPTSEIIRTDLMGSNQKKIVSKNLGVVSGLTIDHHRSILYWADNYQIHLECSDFDGNNRKFVMSDLIVKPLGLYFFEDSLYWRTESGGVLRKRKLYGDKLSTFIPIGTYNLQKLFVLAQVSRQPEGVNKCKGNKCSHLCVIRKGEPTCICANGALASVNGTSCPASLDVIALEESSTPHLPLDNDGPIVTAQKQSGYSHRQSNGAFTGLAVAVAVFAALSFGYVYLKRKKPDFFKRRDLSIRFTNPSFIRRNNMNNTSTCSSTILIPGEHEYTNPATELSDTKLNNSEPELKKSLELTAEASDGEVDDPNTNYHSRLIQ